VFGSLNIREGDLSFIDIGKLRNWLKSRLPELGDIETLEKFSEGQSNPTYRIGGTGGAFVLRRSCLPHMRWNGNTG